jgi:hypothetical protein
MTASRWRRQQLVYQLRAQRPQAVMLYTTSLRGLQGTFADCAVVRAIRRWIRVAVDERNVSMDTALHRKLQALLAARGLHAGGEGEERPTMLLGDERRGRNGGEVEEVMAEEDGRAVASLPPAMSTETSTSRSN